MTTCRSCGAEIQWAEFRDSGRKVPLDVTRDGRGNVISTPNGNLAEVAGMVHRYADLDAKLARDRRVSHFATCPNADDWRRK